MKKFLRIALLSVCVLLLSKLDGGAQNWDLTYSTDYTKYGSVSAYNGQCTALSEGYLYVGGYNDGGTADNPYGNTQTGMGIVTIMQKNAGSWQTTLSYLKPSDAATLKYFGYSVATEGDYVVVGATESQGKGSVYIFERPAEGWAVGENNEIAKLTASNGANYDQFGFSVDISGDIIVVGAPYNDAVYNEAGQVYLFEKPASGWTNATETAILNQASSAASSNAGYSVSCENDVVVVGALKARISLQISGAVYVYEKPTTGWATMTETAALTPNTPLTGTYLGYSVALSGSTIVAGAPGNPSYLSLTPGSIYVYEKSGSNWTSATQTATLYSSESVTRNYLGSSVGIQDNMITAGEPGYGENAGAVRMYIKPATGWANGTEDEAIYTTYGFSSYNGGTSLLNGELAAGTPSDNFYAGGVEIYKYAVPVVQSKNINVSISSGTATIDWTDGNADQHVVFVTSGSTTATVVPVAGTTYTANTTFGSGSSIMTKGPTFWYCVFNGTTHNGGITVTGLSANTTYRVMVCDYNGDPGSEFYLTTSNTNNPQNFTTGEILPEVTCNVAEKKLINTSVTLEYNLNESANWYPCTNVSTSNVEFVPGKVKIRQASYPANEVLITTLATPAAPAFTINYPEEITNEIAPTSIEYNSDNNFETGNLTGTDTEIALVPGQDLYLRYKATVSDLASDIQHLVVNSRPAASAFSIDYENETAYNIVATAYEYAENDSYTLNLQTAVSQYVPVTPGVDLWFRRQANSGSFAGESYFLDVPERPAAPVYSIDYVAEQTNEIIPNTVKYTSDSNFQTGIITGAAVKITVVPGTNLYFKGTASTPMQRFATEIFELLVPVRPSAPAFSVNFINETTSEAISSTYEYATNSTFTSGLYTGTSTPVSLTPGTNLWFRLKASNTNLNFKGNSQALAVPSRISGPLYSINFPDETTNQAIPATVEYNTDNNFSTANTSGEDQVIPVIPGTNTYFRYKATESAFASSSTQLTAPARPAGPVITINYADETTNQTVSFFIEYNFDNHFENENYIGYGVVLPVTPGVDMYFRQAANTTQFASEVIFLDVPARNAAPSFAINYALEHTTTMVFANQEYNYVDAQFSEGGTQGTTTYASVFPGSSLYLRWKAQANSFASETFTLAAPGRPSAPTLPDVDDNYDTFGWTFNPEYNTASDYQITYDDLVWTSCTTNPVSVGNVNLAAGGIKVRVAASNSEPVHFCSEALASDAPFTYALQQYTLTLNYTGSGTLTVNGEVYTAPVTVEEGTQLTIAATPATNWSFSGWTGDLTSSSTTETITMTGNQSITATFTHLPGTYYYLHLYISGSGNVNVNGQPYSSSIEFLSGTVVTLEAAPADGWLFDGWSGDVNSLSSTETITMNRTKDIWVTFSEIPAIMRTLSLDITGTGSVTVNGAPYTQPVVVEDGTTLALEATPESGWMFDSWGGDLNSSGTYETITMDNDKSVSATFTEIRYFLNLLMSGEGTITVNGEEYTGTTSYLPGTELTIVATAATGYVFNSWSGDISASTATITTTINGNMNLFAHFDAVFYTLNLNQTGSGTISVDGENYTDPVDIQEGSEVTLTATPEDGWQFDGWSGDLVSSEPSASFIMNNNKTITATFSEIPVQYTLTITVAGSGSATVNGNTYSVPVTVNEGSELTISATEATYWHFQGWSGDINSTQVSETITMNSDMNITLTFIQNNYTVTITKAGSGDVFLNGWNYQFPYSYPEGTRISMTAWATEGWHFTAWSGDITSTNYSQAFNITGDVSVTATFEKDVPEIPIDLSVSDVNLSSGESTCYNAQNEITVAGNATSVVLESNSTSVFIAGSSIRFLPGFKALPGSSVKAFITTDGSFCDDFIAQSPLACQPVEKTAEVETASGQSSIVQPDRQVKIYPNPGKGIFTLNLMNYEGFTKVAVSSLSGAEVMNGLIADQSEYRFDISHLVNGIYLVRLQNKDSVSTIKIIKQ